MSEKLSGDYRKYSDKKYLYHWDLPEGEDLVVTIDHIEREKLENKKKGSTDVKLVLYFKEDVKPLALNKKENPERIYKAVGSRKVEDWIGKRIALYVEEETRSEDGLAVRIRPMAPKVEEAICEDCKRPVTRHGDYSVNKIITRSKARFGLALCWDCSMKRLEQGGE